MQENKNLESKLEKMIQFDIPNPPPPQTKEEIEKWRKEEQEYRNKTIKIKEKMNGKIK